MTTPQEAARRVVVESGLSPEQQWRAVFCALVLGGMSLPAARKLVYG